MRCWVDKSTIKKEMFGGFLVEHQMEGLIEEWGELEKKEVKPRDSNF